MKKFGKKLMAFAMATVMMSSSITVFADEVTDERAAQGYATGSGSIITPVDKEVFTVVLPTDAGDTFNFTLDPQKLLNAAFPDEYDDAEATLYFSSKKKTSAPLEIMNKSSIDVKVSVDAEMTDPSGLIITDDPTFEGDEGTSLYLGLILNGQEAVALDQEKMITASTTLAKVDEQYFEMTGDPLQGTAEWKLKETGVPDDAFATTNFYMTGACNANADWSKISKMKNFNPTFEVTWTIEKNKDAAPSVSLPYDSASSAYLYTYVIGTASSISLDLGVGEKAAKGEKLTMVISTTLGGGSTTANGVTLNTANHSIDFASTALSAAAGQTRYIRVTFDDPDNTQIDIKVSVTR